MIAGRSVRGSSVPAALGTLLVCLFYMQIYWGCPSAQSAEATSTTTTKTQPAPTPRGLTTGFYEANIQGGPAATTALRPRFRR